MERYWVPHQEHAWLPCALLESNADTLKFQADEAFGKEQISLPAKELANLAQVDAQQEAGAEDVCGLTTVNEAALLHTVRVRYLQNLIYTRVARVLIALNPFRALPIYSSKITDQYMAASDSTDLPPHIFGLSKDAVQGLRETTRDQAVLISGESGAGKTESAKLVLNFVTEAVRSHSKGGQSSGTLVEKVCGTSPVLEAFGNAMTVRNNNSSRFGKWLDLRFSTSLELLGCSLTSYLLETTRVCSQSSGERCFHVFFQLLQARDSPAMAPLRLKEPGSYRYLQGAQLVAPGVNDTACYEELCDALTTVGFDECARMDIFKAVAGILTMGNVEFKAGDQALVQDPETIKQVSDLLGVDEERLLKCITIKKLQVGSEQVSSPLNSEQASAARDAMARLCYGQLFLWLIERTNQTLRVGETSSGPERLLGVLDIAGFESFAVNSLEQLLINLSNEHLQQNFNNVVFKQELKACEEEGVKPPENLGFMDNSDVLALIDGKGGVLDQLDEAMNMPKPSNQKYVDIANKAQVAHKRFIKPKIACLGFGIQHFAGSVMYSCEGWLDKNANRSPPDANQLLSSSSNPILAEIGKLLSEEEKDKVSAQPSRAGASKKVKSVTAQFRASLRSLMTKINEADPHYIRCVKPNMEKVPGRIVGRMAMEQLLLSGVLATVRIRQQGYAVRLPHRTFVLDYRVVAAGKKSLVNFTGKDKSEAEFKTKAQEVIDYFLEHLPSFKGLGGSSWAVGKTKVFLNLAAARVVDEARSKALYSMAVRVQKVLRGRRARKAVLPRRKVAEGIRSVLRSTQLDAPSQNVLTSKPQLRKCKSGLRRSTAWTGGSCLEQVGSVEKAREKLKELGSCVDKADEISFTNMDVMQARLVQRRLTLEADTVEQMLGLSTSLDTVELEKVIARGAGLRLPRSLGLGALEERLEKLRVQQPLIQAMTATMAEFPAGSFTDTAIQAFEDTSQAVRDAGLDSEGWLPQLDGANLYSEVRARAATAAAKVKQLEEEAAAKKAAEEAAAQRAIEEAANKKLAEERAAKEASEAAAAAEAARLKAAQEQEAAAAEAARKAQEVAEEAARRKAAEEAEAAAAAAAAQKAAEEAKAAQEERERQEAAAAAAKEAEKKRPKTLRSRSRTVVLNVANSEETQVEAMVRKDLKKAKEALDVKALEGLLRKVSELGMQDEADARAEDGDSDGESEGIIHSAMEVFKQLQSVDFITANIERLSQEVAESPTMDALQRLENLSKQLRKMPGYEEEAAQADASLRRGLMRRTQKTHRKSVFDTRDAVELELATTAFGKLTDFPNLKMVWAGERRPTTGSAAQETKGVIAHSKTCIEEAMTNAPLDKDYESFEAAAVQNFRNILVCMGDRPAQECQRAASRDAILELATVRGDGPSGSCYLQNEVYIQVMKQLVACPRERTMRLGWSLLQKLCMQAPPAAETAEFVRYLINGFLESRPGDRDSAATARSCLNILDGATEEVEGDTEETMTPARLKAEYGRLKVQNKELQEQVERQAEQIARLTGFYPDGRTYVDNPSAPGEPSEEGRFGDLKREHAVATRGAPQHQFSFFNPRVCFG